MATAIEENCVDNARPFGGCWVLVAPGSDRVLTTLLLDSTEDAAQFWALIKSRAEVAARELDMQDRQRQGFGGFGR